MKITELSLQNIGPFKEAHLELATEGEEKPAVVLITGENGTGKSIIIDFIRAMFGEHYGVHLSRDINRYNAPREQVFGTIKIQANNYTGEIRKLRPGEEIYKLQQAGWSISSDYYQKLIVLPRLIEKPPSHNEWIKPNWIIDYWPSSFANKSYQINNFFRLSEDFLSTSLSGNKEGADMVNLICNIDYLRDSREKSEQKIASFLYQKIEEIFSYSLSEGGKFSHVARTKLEPRIIQNGHEIALNNLSSGNLYLAHNLIDLLGKMYALHRFLGNSIEDMCLAPGLLLIDEAENQLHPKWQKRLIPSILKLFPNLQIIATTHSPFIISSVENAKLFVCKAEGDHCVVEDVSGKYSNKPVDEILASPLFDETLPFNQEITDLLKEHDQAIENGDEKRRLEIEAQLKALNPQYFSYFDIRNLLKEVVGEK